jgi:hypothetical protein
MFLQTKSSTYFLYRLLKIRLSSSIIKALQKTVVTHIQQKSGSWKKMFWANTLAIKTNDSTKLI